MESGEDNSSNSSNIISGIHTNIATLEPSSNTRMVAYKKSLEIPMHPVSKLLRLQK